MLDFQSLLDLVTRDMYTMIIAVLAVAFLVVRRLSRRAAGEDKGSEPPAFASFRTHFVRTYLIMSAADWMQGPTVYRLYEHYGFTHQENAVLFVIGFMSSMIFGSFAGTLADKYGRKRSCMLYGIVYSLCCLTKHSGRFEVLLVGRVLGGFSTSILWSSFESWMVSEHHKRGFDNQLLGSTFGLMMAGNGFIAIAAGLAAQGAVYAYGGHPVAPFDASLVLLVIGTIVIGTTWDENHGDASQSQAAGLAKAWRLIRSNKAVFFLGLAQSLFEAAMYTFVFSWTPSLQATGDDVPHGLVFASMMMSVSIGATVHDALAARAEPEAYMLGVFALAAACMVGVAYAQSAPLLMLCFCGYEVCVGIFWPSIMSMRSRYIPDEGRATVMNLFRVPLNFLVCLVLLAQSMLSTQQTFLCCAAANALCIALLHGVRRHAAAPRNRPASVGRSS
eukprot:TRINITY_DN1911_c0_g1_i1.p1 TRINITY_DN1911_c0_g1~~TRINITY_DN1911_c0_g1_i1.p1  ORF type:complete len:472 (+),score=154.28 TRINITY_DN1911_c0_g1_i1:79-1416(+)